MPVQKSRRSRARQGTLQAHRALKSPTLSTETTSGEVHRRHHMTEKGYYKGKKVINIPEE